MVPLRPNNVDAVDAVNEWVEAPDAVQVEEEAGQLDDDSDEEDGTDIEWFPLEELDDGGGARRQSCDEAEVGGELIVGGILCNPPPGSRYV
jgi:hypothetical protein